MASKLNFEYDEVGDTLSISKVRPYAEQETEELDYNVLARRNPRTGAVEVIEILFFTQWLSKGQRPGVKVLSDLFEELRTSTA